MARPMKDSGVQWIGKIPIGWDVRKVKSLYSLQTGFTPDTKNETYYDDENGYDWITIGDLNGSKVIPDFTKSSISQEYVDKFSPVPTPKGSLLYSFKLSVGQVAFANRDVYTNEAIASFIDDGRQNLNYLFYSSYMIVENANDNIYGAKILNQDLIRNAVVTVPPLTEQQKIASFLDIKCAAIDDVLAKTQESIEEYKKLKQAVITESVTKGVRGKRPMKDSGVNWIGQIPKDWNVDKLKRILTERNESNDPVQTSERLSLSIDTGVTLYAEKTTNLDRFKEDVSQYKLAHIGDLVMNSMNVIVGAVGVSDYFGCVSPAYYTYYDNEADHITARYMDYVFRTKSLRALLYRLGKGIYAIDRGDGKVNTCRLKVSREDMRSLLLPLPSVEEQREIVSYLDKKCEDIEALITKKQQFIDELTAYKKSLIYEYVTGKKEVPV